MSGIVENIAEKENLVGELFDLSIPTLNNPEGYHHIIYCMFYGTYLPIEKYIEELERILYNTGEGDDKYAKRKKRLQFLEMSSSSPFISSFFSIFTNYLNGGGSNPKHNFGNYENQKFLITCAGGNIITLFAQLLANIIDAFIEACNQSFGNRIKSTWDILDYSLHGHPYPKFNTKSRQHQQFLETFLYAEQDKSVFNSVFNANMVNILENAYKMLTDSNKIILDELTNSPLNEEDILTDRELIYYIFYYLWSFNRGDQWGIDIVRDLAILPHSDFDYKLSPNLATTMTKECWADDDDENIVYIDKDGYTGTIQEDIDSLLDTDRMERNANGFMLIRAKTVVECDSTYKTAKPTGKQQKEWKRDCYHSLGQHIGNNAVTTLCYQTFQNSYLDYVNPRSDCYKLLEYFAHQKQNTSESTANNIDIAMKYFLSGHLNKELHGSSSRNYFRQPQINSTESVLHYIKSTVYNLNIYISHWEKGKLTKKGLGAAYRDYDLGVLDLSILSYRNVYYSFLNLQTIHDENNYAIPRLSADLLMYYLSDPKFQVSNILHSLISTLNYKKRQSGKNACTLSYPKISLVPTSRLYSYALGNIKKIFEYKITSGNMRGSKEFVVPEGVRITINTVESQELFPAIKYEANVTDLNNGDMVQYLKDLDDLKPEHEKLVSEVDIETLSTLSVPSSRRTTARGYSRKRRKPRQKPRRKITIKRQYKKRM